MNSFSMLSASKYTLSISSPNCLLIHFLAVDIFDIIDGVWDSRILEVHWIFAELVRVQLDYSMRSWSTISSPDNIYSRMDCYFVELVLFADTLTQCSVERFEGCRVECQCPPSEPAQRRECRRQGQVRYRCSSETFACVSPDARGSRASDVTREDLS